MGRPPPCFFQNSHIYCKMSPQKIFILAILTIFRHGRQWSPMVANGRQGSPRFKGWLRWVKRVKRFFEKSAFWDRLITIPIEAFSLLGRLEGLGTGGAVALTRRSFAAQQEQMWSRQRQAHAICVKQGRELLRRGQFRQVSCETSLFLVFVLFFYFGFWSFLFWYFVYIFLFSFSGAKTQFPLLL